MKQSDFKKNGRLGCPACYSAFEEELAPMLKAMHRQVRHVGKVPPHSPPPEAGATDNAAERVRLQRLLDAAVAREAFEEAARLRDQIRALSPDPKTGTARRAGGKPPS
jgi:protein arginine kinase activator